MFYPEESLKKGGRFYLCWVADSWPLCFATITQRQLWSQDIRKICDDLLEVMNNESGRPAHRFSLRLSSQLMRGVVRLYQKKVNILLSEICMINARVMKNSNKKYNIHQVAEETERRLFPLLELPAPVREPVPEPEPEDRVEQMIQQSGNVVTNIEDITLKEAAIPEFQLPPNDGFGEENPNQALQLLHDRTLEQMLGATSAAGISGLDIPPEPAADSTLGPRLGSGAHMERVSDQDVTMFRKSTAPELVPEELDKDIPIPEIPLPDLPAPTEKELQAPERVEEAPAPEPAKPQEPVEEELEELEETEPQVKRRRKNKLIIDKCTQLSKKFLRSRIDNINLELRCEDPSDDIAELRVPSDILLQRPARAGARFPSHLARALTRMFSRNLGYAASATHAQRQIEVALASRGPRRASPALERIPEEPPHPQLPPADILEPPHPQLPPADILEPPHPQLPQPNVLEPPQPADQTVLDLSAVLPDLTTVALDEDIALLPTQKLETASQKRPSQEEPAVPAKKRRTGGYVSLRENQSQNLAEEIVDKENIPDNMQTISPPQIEEQPFVPIIPEIEIQRPSDPGRLASMLQEAGLADLQTRPEEPVQTTEEPPRKSRRRASDSSETMLGSLDRTKVSLGDSDQTTDSKRFIRDQWGTEGTMVKILKMVKAKLQPVNVSSLLSYGPVVPGYTRIIAARCFTSILKLKQHGFIKVRKDPDSLEVLEIFLGPKFDI